MENKIKNIKKGQVFKNYKDLCNYLGCKVKGGNAKIYHLKELERYFQWKTEGYKIIIIETYTKPKQKIDNRKYNKGGNNIKYDQIMDTLLLYYIIDGCKTTEITMTEIFELLNLFKPIYNSISESYSIFAERYDMSKGLVRSYYLKCRDTVKCCIETALNRLQRNGTLTWYINTYLKCNGTEDYYAEDLGILNKLKDAEHKIYNKMKINPTSRIISSINKIFKSRVLKLLEKKGDINISIYDYWKKYIIEITDESYTTNYTEEQIKEMLEDLKYRFIQSITDKIKRIKSKDDGGNIFYPYTSDKNINDIKTLHKLIWNSDILEQKEQEKLEWEGEILDTFLLDK